MYDVIYDEGVFTGYRWYEAKNIEPLYPFGFGLSYADFEYSKLKLSASEIKPGETLTVKFVLENTLKIASGSDFFKAVRMNTDADLAPLLKQFFQNPPSY